MHEGELVEGQWLLAHEANVKGWLPNKGGLDFVASDKYFGPMKAAGVSFYDEMAILPIAVKPVPEKDYGELEDDLDLDHLLGMGSG